MALQSQATRLTGRIAGGGVPTVRGYYPLRFAITITNCTGILLSDQSQTTIQRPGAADFHIELIPLHSPLLGESLLVSFPPLSNMFKFGGYSHLSPALVRKIFYWHATFESDLVQHGSQVPCCIGVRRSVPTRVLLKRCTRPVKARRNAQQPLLFVLHFAFGKRVWTRRAPSTKLGAAICVQRFDDSLNPAIHITYRVSRRSSSLREPRDPSLKGVL